MNNRSRSGASRVLRRFTEATVSQEEFDALRRRVAELENEMQESRRLHRRLAELTDVVQELLVPIAQRDEAKLREHLDRYSASL